jgi:hypothetical protein
MLDGFLVQGDQVRRIPFVLERGSLPALILDVCQLELERAFQAAQEIEGALDGDVREVTHDAPPTLSGVAACWRCGGTARRGKVLTP